MSAALSIMGRLYAPLALVLLVVSLAATGNVGRSPNGHIAVEPLGGLINFEIPIHSEHILILFAFLATLAILSSYLFIDYAGLFPREYEMEVFFDVDGLRNAIRRLRLSGCDLAIAARFEAHREEYFAQVNADIATVIPVKSFFSPDVSGIYSHGTTSFVVRRVSGLQKYHVVKAEGQLYHIVERPKRPPIHLHTLFEHLPSAADHLDVRILDIITGRGVLIRPRFKQILPEDRTAAHVTFRHCITGATRVRVFPWPDISPTVYLAEFEHAGLVPVAYAVYK